MKKRLFGAGELACDDCSRRRNVLKTAIAVGPSMPLLAVLGATDPKMAHATQGSTRLLGPVKRPARMFWMINLTGFLSLAC